MNQKTIIITGASDGIGAAAARQLAKTGAHVVLVGRSPEKTKAVADELGAPYYIADFAELAQVKELVGKLLRDFPKIDVLANNAGAIINERQETADGHEMTFQVNHLATFLLTELLMDRLVESRATIITTSSYANRLGGQIDLSDIESQNDYNGLKVYGKTKLMNILFTKQLHARYHDKGISAAAFHPGIVRTGFSSNSGGLIGFFYKAFVNRFFLSPEQGADTLVWLATSTPGTDWESGEYYAKRKPSKTDPQADNEKLALELWDVSEQMTAEFKV